MQCVVRFVEALGTFAMARELHGNVSTPPLPAVERMAERRVERVHAQAGVAAGEMREVGESVAGVATHVEHEAEPRRHVLELEWRARRSRRRRG